MRVYSVQADAIHDDKWVTIQLEKIPDLILDENEIRQVFLLPKIQGLVWIGCLLWNSRSA